MSFFRRCLTRCWRRKFPSFSFHFIHSLGLHANFHVSRRERNEIEHMLGLFHELGKEKLGKIKNSKLKIKNKNKII